MHKYTPLDTRIKNGDFEISDYRQQAFYELWLLDDRLKTEHKKYPSHEAWMNRREVIEKQQYDRYHKLMNAFDKEEPKNIRKRKLKSQRKKKPDETRLVIHLPFN